VSTELTCLAAFVVAVLASYLLTPVAIRVAERTRFYDVPAGYKGHRTATPYLGGSAVFAGFVLGALTLGGHLGDYATILAIAAGLWLVGTIDDRIGLPPVFRLLAEVVAAVVLWSGNLGWNTFTADWLNLALTIVWIVGLVNAFNLMDNLDGAASTVCGVSALGVGVLALATGNAMAIAALSFAVAGACAGFLPRNLARSGARIFLGDGGSMTLGFLVAALAALAANDTALGGLGILQGAMLVGLPILDVALVVFSRRRRGVPMVTAGRDHLTHRLLNRVGTPRRVALILAAAQGTLCALAIGFGELGRGWLAFVAAAAVGVGIVRIGVFESPTWRAAPVEASPRSRRLPEFESASSDAR
jgi:UDP-GlcNAc:undecaprenyl-phosphate/decaprenyl-phosphate GlcNAc-1-phosphate transferase